MNRMDISILPNFEPDGFDCMRDKFLGMYHTEDNPVAVINGKCSGSKFAVKY